MSASARPWLRPVLFLCALGALCAAALALNGGARLAELREWLAAFGAWGPAVFVGVYFLACLAMVPCTALSLLAGALFGSGWGLCAVVLGSNLGSAACFLIARYAARDAVQAWAQNHERFRRLDELTRRHGGWVVALTRLVPLFPFNLLNYGLGLTAVRFWVFVLGTFLCMLPYNVLAVVGADVITRALLEGVVSWPLVAGVAALVPCIILLARAARRRLREGAETHAE